MAPGAKASAPEIAAGVATPTLHRVANDPAAETLPPYSPRAGTHPRGDITSRSPQRPVPHAPAHPTKRTRLASRKSCAGTLPRMS